jgi:hypothetical protein
LIPVVSTPPFESAEATFLLNARFAFLMDDLDAPCVVVGALAASLPCAQALTEATTINAAPASLSVLIAFIFAPV